MLALPPLSLYIHYPWCVKKCPYCDFNSHEGEHRSGYIETLLQDLEDDLMYLQDRTIHSIFIGGGTPSLMSEQALAQLFDGLKQRLKFEEDIEITLESNPGTFEVDKFKVFKQIGINRLSIGVQSFNDTHLQSLGRIHNANNALEACQQAGNLFDQVNIDLMYALEGQTIRQSLDDINQAIALNPSHISLYQLTIEPNTLFAKFPPRLPNEEDSWAMGERGTERLEAAGFKRYEVSAFGKIPSKHNINYWEFGDYIGIGAGAHGKITSREQNAIIRTVKSKSPQDYLHHRQTKKEIVGNQSFEFMLNALRLKQGFSVDLFESRTGQSIEVVADKIHQAEAQGLLIKVDNQIMPSKKGFDFLNDLQAYFM